MNGRRAASTRPRRGSEQLVHGELRATRTSLTPPLMTIIKVEMRRRRTMIVNERSQHGEDEEVEERSGRGRKETARRVNGRWRTRREG